MTTDANAKAATPFALWAGATFLLLLPAIYNRFPLVFPDTGAYFSVAWSSHWTLDRSGFYGLFFRPLSFLDPQVQLWAIVFIQASATAAIILLAMREALPKVSTATAAAIIVALAALTSLPWHAAQLMPDAFTALVVLLVWLACMKDPGDAGAPTLWLCVYLAGLLHYTHVFLVLAAGAATLLTLLLLRAVRPGGFWLRAAVCAGVAAAILATQTVANGVFLKRWTPAPMGSMFLFARLHEDGLVQPWLARNCATGRTPTLCHLQPNMPQDSQALLWGQGSEFHHLVLNADGTSSNPAFISELSEASAGSILRSPLAFASSAIRAGADQFVHFAAMDDECPEVCARKTSAVYDWFRVYRPSLVPPLEASAQLKGTIPKALLRSITTPVATFSLLLLPLVILFAIRSRRAGVAALSITVLACLAANAILAGALSDVHDRYQSRVVWLAPFALFLAVAGWRREARNQQAAATAAATMPSTQ